MHNLMRLDANITADEMRMASAVLKDYCDLVGLDKANPRAIDKQAELLMLIRHGVKDLGLLRRVAIELRDFWSQQLQLPSPPATAQLACPERP